MDVICDASRSEPRHDLHETFLTDNAAPVNGNVVLCYAVFAIDKSERGDVFTVVVSVSAFFVLYRAPTFHAIYFLAALFFFAFLNFISCPRRYVYVATTMHVHAEVGE